MGKFAALQGFRNAAFRILTAFALLWSRPWCAATLAGLCYAAFFLRRGSFLEPSPFPYFVYLSDAFLHGQTYLRLTPQTVHDLSIYQDRLYLYWGPLPALLFLPLVALFGPEVTDVLPTLLLSALSVGLFAKVLGRYGPLLTPDEPARRGLLTLTFAVGTAYFPLSVLVTVWSTSQMVAMGTVLAGYLAAVGPRDNRLRYFLTGLAAAATLATRPSAVPALLLPAFLLFSVSGNAHRFSWITRLALFLIPITVTAALLAMYNYIRFGSFGETGHVFQNGWNGPYGHISWHYLKANLSYLFLAYPIPWHPAQSWQGGSIILLTPLFIFAVEPLRRLTVLKAVLAGCILLAALPGLLVVGGGALQIGPRYSLDYIVPLSLLTLAGMARVPERFLAPLVFASAVQYMYLLYCATA